MPVEAPVITTPPLLGVDATIRCSSGRVGARFYPATLAPPLKSTPIQQHRFPGWDLHQTSTGGPWIPASFSIIAGLAGVVQVGSRTPYQSGSKGSRPWPGDCVPFKAQ